MAERPSLVDDILSYDAVPVEDMNALRRYLVALEQDNARLAAERAGALRVVEAARALRKLRSGSVIKVSAWDPAFDDLLAAVAAWEAGAS